MIFPSRGQARLAALAPLDEHGVRAHGGHPVTRDQGDAPGLRPGRARLPRLRGGRGGERGRGQQ
ncbi:hypothetical protein AB0K16_10935 [Nonomuraea jabiensis]|uniref:hypothetical protein n=1 Tax=Nonomuraea jabiensis TaxID=882448 RepID=UPI00343B2201